MTYHRVKPACAFAMSIFSICLSTEAATLEVGKSGAPYTSIQTAINASLDGDTIVVGPGLYTETLQLPNWTLTIRSSTGPIATTLDGSGSGTAIMGGGGGNITVSGFTVTGCVGRAIDLEDREGRFALYDCVLKDNQVGVDWLIYLAKIQDFELSNNILIGPNTGYAVILMRTEAFNSAIISNNLFMSWGSAFWDLAFFEDVNTLMVRENVFCSNGDAIVGSYATGWGGENAPRDYDNNLMFENGNDLVLAGTLGPGTVYAAPEFTSGPLGDYYLSQIASGQAVDSPAVDAGSVSVSGTHIEGLTTRIDGIADTGTVDIGYHYPPVLSYVPPTDVEAGASIQESLSEPTEPDDDSGFIFENTSPNQGSVRASRSNAFQAPDTNTFATFGGTQIQVATDLPDGDFLLILKFEYDDSLIQSWQEVLMDLYFYNTTAEEWSLAVAGNTTGTPARFLDTVPDGVLGHFGVNTLDNYVWAVVDHATVFAPTLRAAATDFDEDGDVDLADFSLFAACFNGPNRAPAGGCTADTDLDGDGDVDLTDFSTFAACFNGPNRAPACDPNPVPPGMVLVPAGEFQMGDALDGLSDAPVHAVYVDAFYMDTTEVTKSYWDEVRTWATANGYSDLVAGAGKAANHPVETVSWYDCVKWCNARSQRDGRTWCYYTNSELTTVYKTGQSTPYLNWDANGYRLPTEAEWEKAARGSVGGRRFPWGSTINHDHANYWACGSCYPLYDTSPYTSLTYHPTFQMGGLPYTNPVDYFAPNNYGLHDMAGNVWEWCNDWYLSSYYSSSPYNNPRGPTTAQTYRVLRGGCWGSNASYSRVADRSGYTGPANHTNSIGFRCAAGTGGD
ncbi:MAG: SUMF1/EgtB/PvdO family nonheme iron enzyme [Phycisphaerae bacterium]|nr:SUMF1/EgtB/PvdO family nonheme iron enzyme [Phycisphaerae bacterium]